MFSFINKLKRKKQLKTTDYGRDCGWYIVYKNKRIGELVDVMHDDQFWVSYEVIFYNGFEEYITDVDNWNDFLFENKCFNEFISNAVPSGDGIFRLKNKSRIFMRGLYILE